jgi:succinylarginine dihydrolase
MAAREINFDGIVGPTHNYAGLSYGNVASMKSRASLSSPKRAALQGLAKVKLLHDLGIPQAVLPPHERPHLPTLRRLGFSGSDAEILASAAKTDPVLLASVSSASAMWTANAATVSPSADTADRRVHFTPANLISNFHRSIEPPATARILRAIFEDPRHFVHHDPLPATLTFSDEGAANHTRLTRGPGLSGIELFTYGAQGREDSSPSSRFPARQTLAASRAIARMHGVRNAEFIRQNPTAIDAGAFHNDVVAVGHGNLLLYHEQAWVNPGRCIEALSAEVPDLRTVCVDSHEVPLPAAIETYLFNSQLVTLPDETTAMIAPLEARKNQRVRDLLDALVQQGVISQVHFVDLRQSMRNGGGPACLRLRVELNDAELEAMSPDVIFTDALHDRLKQWIEHHYRDELRPSDLADPKLLQESRAALDELTQILGLGRLYEFQQI